MPTPVENPPPLNRVTQYPYSVRRFPIELIESDLATLPVVETQPADETAPNYEP